MSGGLLDLAVLAWWFALGAVVGSFLNVCIHRLPRGESVVRPRSRCPSCGAPIRWHENIPIVSWALLSGRCAACRGKIAWRYPVVEAVSGALVAGLFVAYGPTAAFAIAAFFALSLLVLFFTDLDHQLLPDAVTLPGLAVGLGSAWWNPFLGEEGGGRLVAAAAGAAVGGGFLWAVGAAYGRLRGVEAMGLGDVKLMAMAGAFTGPKGVVFTLLAASVTGAAVGLALIPLRGKSLKDALPFGCFLAPAALAGLLFGADALDRYLDALPRLLGAA